MRRKCNPYAATPPLTQAYYNRILHTRTPENLSHPLKFTPLSKQFLPI